MPAVPPDRPVRQPKSTPPPCARCGHELKFHQSLSITDTIDRRGQRTQRVKMSRCTAVVDGKRCRCPRVPKVTGRER